MKNELAHFVPSDELQQITQELFLEEKARILSLEPNAEVEHVGSSAIPGALTMGDLDIQIRVTQEEFDSILPGLASIYHVNRKEMWNKSFALFHRKDHHIMPMSIVVTVKGTSYDEFSRQRDLLKASPDLLERYNALKRSYEGKQRSEYRKAKKEFFGPNGSGHLLKRIPS